MSAARTASARRPLLKAALLGLGVGLAGVLVAITPFGVALERDSGLRTLFRLRGPVTPPKDVVVLAIDSHTGEAAGLPSLPRDWPRSVHARIVDALVERGASAIAFDMQFDRARDGAEDQRFSEAVARAERVALIQLATGKRQPVLSADGQVEGSVWVEGLVDPIAPLKAAAKGMATFPLPKIDATVTGFWAFKESLGDAATLPALMLQLHALRVWPAWRALLVQAGLGGAAALPADAAGLGREEAVVDTVRRLREAALSDPARVRAAALADASPERALLQALAALYAGDAHRTLNFYGPPGSIATIPFQALLSGDTAFDFRGKAVFVGFSDLYDPGQPDRFYSVFTSEDGVDLSGVEIAATAFANLLEDRSIVALDPLAALAAMFAFGLVLSALAYLLPAIAGVPLVLALAAAWAIAAVRLFAQDLWLPTVVPLLVQLPLALFLGLIAQYLLERRRRQHAGAALSYYLPEGMARELTEQGAHPEAYNKVVFGTCLSTDMSGFSTISERLPPDQLARFLNQYFDALAGALRRRQVDVTEFRADAIMCAWTAAAPALEPRRRAVHAAIEAVQAIEAFRRQHSQLSSSLRVGLEAGQFYVGHAGGGGHFVFSIVGDTANTAARLESLNKHLGTSILASAAVVEGMDDLLLRPLGEFRLMGKREATAIVEVLATAAEASDTQRARAGGFAAALALYREGSLADAAAAFAALQQADPGDGPAHFFAARCQRELAQPGAAERPLPRVVEMDSK